MNLSELVQVYGSNDSTTQKDGDTAPSATPVIKKTSANRAAKSKRGERHGTKAERRHTGMVFPAPGLVPAIPGSYPYDPSYGSQFGPPMFYGPPMMMVYPVAAPSTYTPPYPGAPTNSAQPTSLAGNAAPVSPSPESIPLTFGPNFVPPSYAPGYMYPYDSAYYYGYAPPQKRAKRAGASQRASGSSASSKPPQSPGSDSAESSSSNTSGAAPISPAEKAKQLKKFHCEPCEKGFKTQQQYEVHLTTHVRCSYEGCSYSAVKGALRMHELLHVNNMFAKLTTPEEIEKYREERKRRFPTMAKEQERLAAKEQEKSLKVAPVDKPKQAAKQAKLTTAVGEEGNQGETTEPTEVSSKEDPCAALEEVDDAGLQQRTNARGKRKRPVCRYWKQGKCNKGEQCTFSHANEPTTTNPPQKDFKRRSDPPPPVNKPGPKTLLSQFLQSEITKENKIILQCLQFIADNHFFKPQPAQPPPPPASSDLNTDTKLPISSISLEIDIDTSHKTATTPSTSPQS